MASGISVKEELRCFDVSPVVVASDQEARIAIRPLFDHVRFDEKAPHRVLYSPIGGTSERSREAAVPKDRVCIENGAMTVSEHFEGEQEHVLLVEALVDSRWKTLGDFRVYSLKPDLFGLRPYKGDFHLHSSRSDGAESPAYVAAACRRIGFSFMAVTDHRKYEPSLEAQDAFRAMDIDLRIFPGEEIHAPENPVHMLNFGGRDSVNRCFGGDAYRGEVDAIMATLGDIPNASDRYQFASCLWCFDKIREYDGLSIFCHPYWIVRNRCDVPAAVTDLLLDRRPYDALELLGGYYRFEAEANLLQVARYHEERRKGRDVPIVGVSDAHGCECGELFGWFYTIALTGGLELDDITSAVAELRTVAVEAVPGSIVRVHGPERLVRYGHFLVRELFPRHDGLCSAEGKLMLAHLAGDGEAASRLASLKGQTGRLLSRLWGGNHGRRA